LPADLHGPIGAERIHDYNLVAPPETFKAIPDVVLFVVTDNDGGDFWPGVGHKKE
jgi:hypothetical protein